MPQGLHFIRMCLIWCATHPPKKFSPPKVFGRGAERDGMKRRKVIIDGSCLRLLAQPIMGNGFARLLGNTGRNPGAIAHNANSRLSDWPSIRCTKAVAPYRHGPWRTPVSTASGSHVTAPGK